MSNKRYTSVLGKSDSARLRTIACNGARRRRWQKGATGEVVKVAAGIIEGVSKNEGDSDKGKWSYEVAFRVAIMK